MFQISVCDGVGDVTVKTEEIPSAPTPTIRRTKARRGPLSHIPFLSNNLSLRYFCDSRFYP